MKKRPGTRHPPHPEELPPAEYYRQLKAGFATLRDECAARDPDVIDPELGARLVQLDELWFAGIPLPASPTHEWRKFPAGKIALLCVEILKRIAAQESEDPRVR